MADSDVALMTEISWYLRERYYRHALNAATDGQKKYGSDAVLRIFCSLAMLSEDRVQEALRELDILKEKQDVNIAALIIMAQAYRMLPKVDQEAVKECENKMRERRKQASEKALYFAGLVTFLMERYDKSREYVTRIIKMNPSNIEAKNLLGWIDVYSGKEDLVKKAIKYFEEANGMDDGKNVDSLMGRARCLELRRTFNQALELLNQVIVGNVRFTPALIEKMRVQLSSQEWDQCVDTAQRCLDYDPGCVEAYKYKILTLLCREGNYQEASREISDLIICMDKYEPKNSFQYDALAVLFSRVCGRSSQILQLVIQLEERAIAIQRDNAKYLTNLGRHQLLLGNATQAIKIFKQALNVDQTSIAAVQGIIECQLSMNMLKEASTQLEFLNELESTMGKSAELHYLLSVLSRRRGENQAKILQHLNETFQVHFNTLRSVQFGAEFYYHLNPDFLLQVVQEYLHYVPANMQGSVLGRGGVASSSSQHPILRRCQQILDQIVRTVPGLQQGLYLLAQVRCSAGDVDGARNMLRTCVEADPTFFEGHLLLAKIHLSQSNFKLAQQTLENCLSNNFEVRDHPLYHFLHGCVLKNQGGQLKEAIRSLQTAMQFCTKMDNKEQQQPAERSRGGTARSSKNFDDDSATFSQRLNITGADKLAIYLELADAYRMNNNEHEAAKILQDAQHHFAGTPEEIRVTISNADLALQRNDVEMALGILRNVTPDQTYFVEARQRMAQIYLEHRKDKRLYAACYRELVDKLPSPQTYLMLGDAYIHVQEPEKAIEVYEKALHQNAKDMTLASKMGAALVKTHNYAKAVTYYEQAVKGGQVALRHDLMQLLIKLKHWEKAEKFARDFIRQLENSNDLSEGRDRVRMHWYLTQVFRGQKLEEEALQELVATREAQSRVLKRVVVELVDLVPEEKKYAAQLCREMAQIHGQRKETDKAIQLYQEALVFWKDDSTAMIELARIYSLNGDLDSCQQQCIQILKLSAENEGAATSDFVTNDSTALTEENCEEASLMMADIMFRKQEYDLALQHVKQLLEKNPNNYVALSRLVNLMRRSGTLEEVPGFLKIAEENNPRAVSDAGYNYCRGLHEWYSGNTVDALLHLNHSRLDNQWSEIATYHMVEICINPDNETLGGVVFDSIDQANSQGNPDDDAGQFNTSGGPDLIGIRTADRLLREMKQWKNESRYSYMRNMVLISTKQKANMEKGLTTLQDLLQKDPDSILYQYGIATAYMMQKQAPKARTLLHKLTRSSWNFEEGDELEKAWLLLADFHIQTGKNDLGQELLKKCLQHNKSCCKAYEYTGFMQEKLQDFKEAAKNYELAWKFCNKSNPVIGYKLSFNYLRATRYVEAIDVCHHVLKAHPNYPKIKKEIMDKARCATRV